MKKIYADTIIEKINEGKNISLRRVEIIGDIDFTTLRKTKRDRIADDTYNSIVPVAIIFKECIFKGAIKTFYESGNKVYYTTFKNTISFEGSKLLDVSTFQHSKFYGDVNFNNTYFSEHANFNNAKFYGVVNFDKTHFFNQTNFNNTKFYDVANFEAANFLNEVSFENTKFYKLKEKPEPTTPLLETETSKN